MLEKIKTHQPKFMQLVREIQDVRTATLFMFLLIALMISWSGIKVIETNYGLQKDISRLRQENEVHKLANRNLQLQNQYFSTEEYLELEGRKNFGLAKPGETVVVVPKSVAMKHTVAEPLQVASDAAAQQPNKPAYVRNLEAWRDFLLHRPSRD